VSSKLSLGTARFISGATRPAIVPASVVLSRLHRLGLSSSRPLLLAAHTGTPTGVPGLCEEHLRVSDGHVELRHDDVSALPSQGSHAPPALANVREKASRRFARSDAIEKEIEHDPTGGEGCHKSPRLRTFAQAGMICLHPPRTYISERVATMSVMEGGHRRKPTGEASTHEEREEESPSPRRKKHDDPGRGMACAWRRDDETNAANPPHTTTRPNGTPRISLSPAASCCGPPWPSPRRRPTRHTFPPPSEATKAS
jgi:hypothetical protein